jgi:hypothetical protein
MKHYLQHYVHCEGDRVEQVNTFHRVLQEQNAGKSAGQGQYAWCDHNDVPCAAGTRRRADFSSLSSVHLCWMCCLCLPHPWVCPHTHLLGWVLFCTLILASRIINTPACCITPVHAQIWLCRMSVS